MKAYFFIHEPILVGRYQKSKKITERWANHFWSHCMYSKTINVYDRAAELLKCLVVNEWMNQRYIFFHLIMMRMKSKNTKQRRENEAERAHVRFYVFETIQWFFSLFDKVIYTVFSILSFFFLKNVWETRLLFSVFIDGNKENFFIVFFVLCWRDKVNNIEDWNHSLSKVNTFSRNYFFESNSSTTYFR